MSREQDILAKARDMGFEAAGIADPKAVEGAGKAFLDFIAREDLGDMPWLAAKADRRRAPGALWAGVRSVIMLGQNYGPETDPLDELGESDKGNISVYARGDDYHDVVKKRLKALARWIVATYGGDVKVFVDTAPVLEKPLAEAAGIGWQGKHTNLVSVEYGSWLFLGAVYTTLDLSPSADGHRDLCGSCRACLDICPTNAFRGARRIVPTRCISYLTIEHKGPIPREFRRAMGNRIYGCDDCLAVCPWNKFAKTAQEAKLQARENLSDARLQDLLALDDPSFRTLFRKSPVKRTGRDRFLRNVLIAAGNSGDPALVPRVKPLLCDESPLVRGAAVWALSRLLDKKDFSDIRKAHLPEERDQSVQAEWRQTA